MKWFENILRIGGFSLCLLLGQAAGATAPVVTDVRIGTHPGHTRLVLEVSQPVSYKIFTLANPYRVVVDFPALEWKIKRPNRRLSLGIVSSYRYGLFQAGVSRLVIDAKQPVKIARHQVLRRASGSGQRFLIDLKGVSEEEFEKVKKVFRAKGWRPPDKRVAVRRPPPLPSRKGRLPVSKRIIMLDPGHGGPDPGAIGVRGNHDFEVVRWHQAIKSGVDPPVVGSEHFHIANCLTKADMKWMYSLPWYINSPDLGALFVHAGFVSGIRLAKQNPRLMMNMRSILPDGTVTSKFFNNWPWARLWDGPQTVLFGHDADRGLQQYEHAIGLDTGCVYGGRLTACILPEKRLVSVNARREYFKYRRKHYD